MQREFHKKIISVIVAFATGHKKTQSRDTSVLGSAVQVVSWDSWEEELESSSLSNLTQKSKEIIPWLGECFVAASPLADIIVIACRNRISFLTSRWEFNESENKKIVLAVNWKGTVGQCDQDEVSSIVCLPIISQKQSSSGAPDWTCIVVGFMSGYISFYTENGLLLISQIFEESAVVNLFCRTYTPKNFGACIYSDLSEELVILYHKSVVTIDGFSLLQTLKACRNQAAKASASGGECTSKMCSLGYKKWSITEQEQVLNCVASGMLPPHLYDHLIHLAFNHGFNQVVPSEYTMEEHFEGFPQTSKPMPLREEETIKKDCRLKGCTNKLDEYDTHVRCVIHRKCISRSSLSYAPDDCETCQSLLTDQEGVPTTFQLLTAGKVPFFGMVGITEGAVQPFIADIAMHYASKIKDALFNAATGWLFGNKQHDQSNNKKIPKIEHAIPVAFRYSLPDKRRIGVSIKLSLTRRLAAITDDFGRITLVDVQKCCVLRMFKGYRDAECGWMSVEGEWRDKWREVSFLIIYAPRRSLLEVWLPQQGPRIAAFNVPKDSRLLYTPHTLLGSNTQRGGSARTSPVILLNQDGTLVQISIPFHLALSGKTGKQARDIHLLKTLKMSLRNDSEDQVLKIIKEIQTTGIKLQVFSLVVGSKFITESLTVGMIDVFLPVFSDNEENQEAMDHQIDHDSRILVQQLMRLRQLLNLYQAIASQHSNGMLLHLSQDEVEMKLSHHLLLNAEEVSFLITNLQNEYLNTSKSKQVTFDKTDMTFSSFLHCWEFNISSINKGATSVIPVQIKKKLSEDLENAFGTFMFGWKFNLSLIEPFYEVLSVSGVNFSQLLNLAFLYWLNLDSIDEIVALHMSFMIFTISIFSQPSMVWDPSSVNPYWESIRCTVVNWCKPLHSFTATLICKGVEAATLLHGRNIASELKILEDDRDNVNIPSLALSKLFARLYDPNSEISCDSSEVFEGLSLEIVEWNLLLNRFQKLLSVHKLFNIISRRGEKIASEFSIKILSTKGKGYLSELISKWLIASNLSVNELLEIINSTLNIEDKDEKALVGMEEVGEIIIYSDLSKEPKIVVEDGDVSSIKDCLREIQYNFPESMKKDVLICNLAWEYGSLWKKVPLQLLNLEGAILALKSVDNPYLKHGIGVMMWETWVVHYVQSASLLMEKLRRTPNDRNSVREIGISEFDLHKLFSLSKNLLEIISTGNEACNKKCFPKIGKDDFWSGMESPPSLVDVAMGQSMTSSDLTFVHLELLCVLCLIVQYSIKNIRPFSLFPERDRAAFFKPLFTVWRETANDAREVVNSSQLAFLNKVISAAVVALPDSTNMILQSNPSGLYDSVELGRTWGVSVDALRRHYVCELYSSGLDTMADQALLMIRDGVLMASQMIIIAGQRLHYLMTSSNKSIQVIALVTPPMKDWCKTLDTGCLRSPDQPIEMTYKMVFKAKSFLSDTSKEYRLAHNLYMTFERIESSGLFRDIS